MARILIKDLPKDMKISKEEMKNITGGDSTLTLSDLSQMFQMQLQDPQQKLSVDYTTLSNTIKNQQDTLTAIVQNLKG